MYGSERLTWRRVRSLALGERLGRGILSPFCYSLRNSHLHGICRFISIVRLLRYNSLSYYFNVAAWPRLPLIKPPDREAPAVCARTYRTALGNSIRPVRRVVKVIIGLRWPPARLLALSYHQFWNSMRHARGWSSPIYEQDDQNRADDSHIGWQVYCFEIDHSYTDHSGSICQEQCSHKLNKLWSRSVDSTL